jgi:hypothetical protein
LTKIHAEESFSGDIEADFDLSFAVNVKGVFHGLQLAWQHLADEGRIITISSSTTAMMLPGYAVYDATKGAVEQFTRILAEEFGDRRITVNAVGPGATETGICRIGRSGEFLGQLEAMSAFARLGQPGEIAAVVFLPGQRRGRLVTAQNIRINGGPPDRGGGRRDSGGRNSEPDRAGAGPAAAHPDPLVRSCQPMVIPPSGCERAPCGRAHQTGDVGARAAARR